MGGGKKTIKYTNMHQVGALSITIKASFKGDDFDDCDCCKAFQSVIQNNGSPNFSNYPSIYDEYADISRVRIGLKRETENIAKIRKELNDFHNILIDATARTLDSVYGKPLDYDFDEKNEIITTFVEEK